MNLLNAWDVRTDCSSTIVAVLDSGVNYNHQDLRDNMWDGSGGCVDENGAAIPGGCPHHGWDTANDDNDPMDTNGHGTHVAGTIGARGDNGVGVAGVCWQARIMAVRVLATSGGGSTTDIVDGIEFAYRNGAKVINMSLGNANYSSLLNTTIANARSNDVLIVAASGNSGQNLNSNNSYPCEYHQDNVLCVGALDQNYNLANFSNYSTASVDVAAPGTNILSTMPGLVQSHSEDFTSGWSGLAAGAWRAYNGGGSAYCLTKALINPTNYCSSSSPAYDAGVDRAAKYFSGLSAASDAVTLHIMSTGSVVYLDAGDRFRMLGDSDADPFSGGTEFINISASTQLTSIFDLSSVCAGRSGCSLGFELDGGSSGFDYGAAIQGGPGVFFMQTLDIDQTNRYDVKNGTSMATPQIAGLAALIRTQNPDYTYEDVRDAIQNGSDSLPALTSTIAGGRAANASSSIKHVAKPGGLMVVIP
jgi:subtilisin family serine protease